MKFGNLSGRQLFFITFHKCRFFKYTNIHSRDIYTHTHIHTHTQLCMTPGATYVKFGNLRGRQLFFITFHTAFHEGDLKFGKTEIDGVCVCTHIHVCMYTVTHMHVYMNVVIENNRPR